MPKLLTYQNRTFLETASSVNYALTVCVKFGGKSTSILKPLSHDPHLRLRLDQVALSEHCCAVFYEGGGIGRDYEISAFQNPCGEPSLFTAFAI